MPPFENSHHGRRAFAPSPRHYLRAVTSVGEHLRYAFVYKGRWLAVATSRLLVLPDCHSPTLISRFMKLMLAQLCEDWQKRWGHPIAMVESFVDPRYYQGTAYKVSGWSHLGKTAGWKRDADDSYEKNGAPKQIWVRERVNEQRWPGGTPGPGDTLVQTGLLGG